MNKEAFLKELALLDESFSKLSPELELTVRDPSMDLEGYVVVHSTRASRGGPLGACGKGGTRITPSVSLYEIKTLARTMTLKNSAAGLALGGAKSGIKADPDSPDFERKYRRFVNLVKPILCENDGIFGGFGFDIGGRPEHPVWVCNELNSTRSFTGKPAHMGGTDYDKEGIAGLGVATAAQTLLEIKKEKLSDITYAVQGVGAMGAAVVRYFSRTGATLKYLADPRLGACYKLVKTTPELIESIASQDIDKTKTILELLAEEKLPVDQVLFQKVDVVFPCAIQDVVNESNYLKLQTRYLVEAANNPCSEKARTELHKRGVVVIPDFIANPGGIIAAYIELLSELPEFKAKYTNKAQSAKDYTIERIAANIQELMKYVFDFNIEPAQAGRYMALKNIFK